MSAEINDAPSILAVEPNIHSLIRGERSFSIAALASALVEAQKKITKPHKGKDNPFFRSKYADLAACGDACRGPLTDNGIAVVARPSSDGSKVSVETMLIHKSGEFLSSILTAQARKEVKGGGYVADEGGQAIGAAITYLRRAGLAAMVFLTPTDEDDDGQFAGGQPGPPTFEKVAAAFKKYHVTISMLEKRIGRPLPEAQEVDFAVLREIYEDLENGELVEAHFSDKPSPAAPEVPAVNHKPVEGTDEPRPGEKKKKAKAEPPPSEPEQTSEQAFEALGEPTPPADPVCDVAERNTYAKKLGEFVPSKSALKAAIQKLSGADTAAMTRSQWVAVVEKFEAAAKEGPDAVKKLVEG